jgi:hypothetical protein
MKRTLLVLLTMITLTSFGQRQMIQSEPKQPVKQYGDDFTDKFDAYTLAIWDLADAVVAETQDINIKEQALLTIEADLFSTYADVDGEIEQRSFYYNLCHVIGSVGYMNCTSKISLPRQYVCLQDFRNFMQTCTSIVRQNTLSTK